MAPQFFIEKRANQLPRGRGVDPQGRIPSFIGREKTMLYGGREIEFERLFWPSNIEQLIRFEWADMMVAAMNGRISPPDVPDGASIVSGPHFK
jgi:hypothetical protein